MFMFFFFFLIRCKKVYEVSDLFFFFSFFRVEKNKMRGQQNYKEILIQRTNENEERTYSLSIRFQ